MSFELAVVDAKDAKDAKVELWPFEVCEGVRYLQVFPEGPVIDLHHLRVSKLIFEVSILLTFLNFEMLPS